MAMHGTSSQGLAAIGVEMSFAASHSLAISSLAYVAPAVTAIHVRRPWFACIFMAMAVSHALLDSCHECSPAAAAALGLVYQVCTCLCVLHMALLILGPEDTQLWGSASWDVTANRTLGLVVLALFHRGEGWSDPLGLWQSFLVSELILLLCCLVFWWRRPSDTLLRYNYWHRLLHQGLIPATMLFWAFCCLQVADIKVLHCAWHMVTAAFAVFTLRASAQAQGGKDVNDNPSVAHLLLGTVALAGLPFASAVVSSDLCLMQWPEAQACQLDGYMVAVTAVPFFLSLASVFWLISSAAEMTGKSHGLRLGSNLGQAGALLGLASALAIRSSALWDLAGLLLQEASLGLTTVAMVLITLSHGCSLRCRITIFYCVPLAVAHAALLLCRSLLASDAVLQAAILLGLALWPLTWVHEVRDYEKSSGFCWPITAWRFR